MLVAVPSLGMQFANDCEWIADQARDALNGLKEGAGLSNKMEELKKAVIRLKNMSKDWRSEQMVRLCIIDYLIHQTD
jgi:hypothetical protein